MPDKNNNENSFLNFLLTVSSEAALTSFLAELRRYFLPIEGVLDILMNQELEEKDSDKLLEIMKQNTTGMHEILDLMRDYLEARESINGANSQSSDYPYF